VSPIVSAITTAKDETGPSSSAGKLALLRRHPVFGAIAPELLERLRANTRAFRRGETIFVKGDPSNSLYAVCTGVVKISVLSGDGNEAVLNLIGENEIFGEIAVLDCGPRTADATAVTDCNLMVIERRDFFQLVLRCPEIALKMIEVLCARLRHTSEQVENILFLDCRGRLAKILLRLTESPGAPRTRRVTMTQREIGQMIGMSRESTNKQLRDWEHRKWVRLERGGIVVVEPDALAAVARVLPKAARPNAGAGVCAAQGHLGRPAQRLPARGHGQERVRLPGTDRSSPLSAALDLFHNRIPAE
jgi:CRP/FNR family transcriptional regulator, cyclic AMP receptor protein